MGRTACTEPQCLYKGALYLIVELYLYSPYGPYGLYRASVPVQRCTLPYIKAIPLLPLWAVRPVQSLSACTRVHFTLPLFSYQEISWWYGTQIFHTASKPTKNFASIDSQSNTSPTPSSNTHTHTHTHMIYLLKTDTLSLNAPMRAEILYMKPAGLFGTVIIHGMRWAS